MHVAGRSVFAGKCVLAAGLLLAMFGCALQQSASQGKQRPSLSPQSSTVFSGTSEQFAANMPGGVVWMVNGEQGGSSAYGTINGTGLYTAPAVAPSNPIIITATSALYPDVSLAAQVNVVNPIPSLAAVSPGAAVAQVGPVQFTVSGANFVPASVVMINGNPYATKFISSKQLQTTVDLSVLQQVPTLALSVHTPPPGGGDSAANSVALFQMGTVTPTQHPLVAQYQIDVPVDGSVSVDFGPDTNYGRQTWKRAAPQGGGTVSILVAGMRANSTYHMRARVDLADGRSGYDSDHTFTTGALPNGKFPVFTATTTPGMTPAGGVELMNVFFSTEGTVVLDTDGSIIWYYYDPAFNAATDIMRPLDNGDFVVLDAGLNMREVDLTGNVVRSLSIADLQARLSSAGYNFTPLVFHHDMLVLPNGHWIVLVQEQKDFSNLPGYPGTTTVVSDALVDVDSNNDPVWAWRALDHLDINRHPFQFPDWTHSNAVIAAPDGNLLLSMRHQSWVIKIDYQAGTGSGAILWRLGYQGDFALTGGDDSKWFYAQHYPVLNPSTGSALTLGVYDNGDTRPDSSSASGICFTIGTCYSRGAVFDIDESAMTATLKWDNAPGWFSLWGGSFAFLNNGDYEFTSTTVNGGSSRILEVSPTGQVVWTMDMPVGIAAYRGYRIPSLYPGVQW